MSLKFWQDFRPASVNLNYWIRFIPARAVGKLRCIIVIPPFSVNNLPWQNASYITLEFRANLAENFSIIRPINVPNNPNFCLAVRSVHDFVDQNNYELDRYKLWSDVGEDLNYDNYSGQTICKSFALEIWNTEGNDKTSLTEDLILETSILKSVEECNDTTPTQLEITEVCHLFAPFPLVFS